MSLSAGAKLGPYEIVSPLGAGGMGEVYRARDTRLDRTVAIKILPETLAADPHFRERFDREARAISQLTHPHICTLYDVGEERGTAFLVMEHLDGETLADRLKKGALLLDEALKTAIQIADALTTAHRHGIVHRDLKPGNVMLTKTGAKLLDFGLAKASGRAITSGGLSMVPTTPPNLTAQGTILGTFQYMAPEQLEGKEADTRTDIFAFGAMLYEMITGQKAFSGSSNASLLSAILKDDPPSITSLQPLAPTQLNTLVKTCLAKDPDERWQSAADVTHALRALRDAQPSSASMSPAPVRIRRERLIWSAAVALLLIALVIVLPVLLRHARETPSVVDAVRLSMELPSGIVPIPGVGPGVQLALSPDGQQLALVVSIGESRPIIWVRALSHSTGQPLRGTEGAELPFWSPDGRALGFFADGKLKKVDAAGGPSQTLCDAPAARGGTWSREGVILLAFGAPTRVFRVSSSSSGGTATAVTTLDASRQESFHRWPQFLPDGRHFLFFTGGAAQARGIAVGSLDGPAVSHVSNADASGAFAPPGYLLFVVEGSLVARRFDPVRFEVTGGPVPVAEGVAFSAGSGYAAFSVSERGVLSYSSNEAEDVRLAWVGRSGHSLGVIPELLASRGSAQLSADGKRVVATRRSNRTGLENLWTLDLARGTPSPLVVDTGQSQSENAVWSPDGKRIVFSSNRQGNYDLYETSSNGVEHERSLVKTGASEFASQWSPDGNFIIYHQAAANGAYDLWTVPVRGDHTPHPYLRTSANEVQGQLSPDGRWMAYASNESGRMEVSVQSFPAGKDRSPISTGGGSDPHWRKDGRELFYLREDRHLMAVAIDEVSGRPGVPGDLFETMMAVDTVTYASQYDVASDGQKFLIEIPAETGNASPIRVALNWTAGLKK